MKYFNLLIFSGLLLTGVFVGTSAEALCLEPKMNNVAPTTYSLLKPRKPRCLYGIRDTRRHSCEEWGRHLGSLWGSASTRGSVLGDEPMQQLGKPRMLGGFLRCYF